MKANQLKVDFERVEQLGLGLVLLEAERAETGFVSPVEAMRRSEAARLALKAKLGHQESPPTPPSQGGLNAELEWMETYQGLLNGGWPWRVACYVAWAASPRLGRWPGTQDELATLVLGLTSDRQITTWRRKNAAIDEMVAILQAAPLMAHRADVFSALARSAANPSHHANPDRKLFLQLTGDYVPTQKVDLGRGEAEDLSGLSDAELDALAGKINSSSTNGANGTNGEKE